jgi:hypothetical protein
MSRTLRKLCLLAAPLLALPGHAILPGIPTSTYPWAAKIGPNPGSFNSSCSAIGDHWIITAKHVVAGNTQMQVHFDNGTHVVSDAIFPHPTDDLALVRFPQTLPGWYQVHWAQPAVGATMEIVGYGWSGTWNGTSWSFDNQYGTKRWARNRYTTTMSGNLGGGIVGTFMVADFDGNGVDFYGDGGPLTNEGTLGGLDSGGPAFIDDGTLKVAGVHIFVGSAGGPQAPQYGSVFGSMRLSDYRTWIDTIMPRETWPTMLHPTRGILVSGNMASLNSSDDNRLVYRPGIVFATGQAPVEYDTMATSPTLNPTKIVFAIESSATSPNIHRTVQLYNYDTLQFETMGTSPSTTTDSVTEYTITSNPGRFVHSNGEVWARISAKAQGPVFAYPWQFAVDRAVWNIQMP